MSGPTASRAHATGDGVQTDTTQVTCVVCNKIDKLLRCSRCKAVFYCTKEHQKRDWKRHKEFCATHPARSSAPVEVPFSVADKNFNRELPSKQHLAVGNHKVSSVPISNLGKSLVSNTSKGLNVTSELHRNTKQSVGMYASLSFCRRVIACWDFAQ